MDDFPQEIKPFVVNLCDGQKGEKSTEKLLVSSQRAEDLKTYKRLFKGADYVLMAPGYTMLGTYKLGSESKLVADESVQPSIGVGSLSVSLSWSSNGLMVKE